MIERMIWKYTLQAFTELEIPSGAEVLDVQVQSGEPQLWALVDPNASLELRRFVFFGTGHPISKENLRYVSTFQMLGGALVFHVFEETTR